MIGVFVWFSLKTFLCFIPVLNECPKTRTVSRSCFVCSPSQVYGYVATTLRCFLPHRWFTLEEMQDAAGMTWEDVDEAAGVWSSMNCVELADGSVRLLKDEKDF